MAYDLIGGKLIHDDMLMIYDRNFSNYKIAALHQWQEKAIKYVIRVKESLNFAKKFIESKKLDDVIDIYPSTASIEGLKECGYIVKKDTPLKIRLIRVKLSSGQIEVLMTNLWEEEGHRASEFKRLYFLRWGVESNIDFQKNILQLEAMSGLTPTTVMQDFYATVMAANLHFLLIKQAQEQIDKTATNKKYPMQVNNNKAHGKIRENMVQLFITKDPKEILKTLCNYFIRDQLPIRKGRSFPRVRKNPASRSKHRTFTNYKPAY